MDIETFFQIAIIYISLIYIFIKFILPMADYIISSIFFIKPMKEKYEIMASDLSNDIKGRYKFIIFNIFVIVGYFMILYGCIEFLGSIFLTINLIVFITFCWRCFCNYKKYDILEYVNCFSQDLFDWDKIYALNIDEDLKRGCFAIHHMDYDEYGEAYIRHLKFKKHMIEWEIDKLNDKE